MMQLKYRNFGSFQAMVVNQTIDVRGGVPIPATHEVAGIRWYELRRPGADWNIHQQATFAPQPPNVTAENQLLHRWMGSAAMDKDGNIALGYSIVNDDDTDEVFPGSRYTGRISTIRSDYCWRLKKLSSTVQTRRLEALDCVGVTTAP